MYVGTVPLRWFWPTSPTALLRVPYFDRPSSLTNAAYQCSILGAIIIEIAGKNSDLIMNAATLRDEISQWTILNLRLGPSSPSSSFNALIYCELNELWPG